MFRKLFYLVSFVPVFSLVSAAQAVTFTQTNDTGDGLWGTTGNWDQGGAPSNYNDDEVRIYSFPGPILDTVGVEVKKVTVVGSEYPATILPLCSIASSVLLLCTSAPI